MPGQSLRRRHSPTDCSACDQCKPGLLFADPRKDTRAPGESDTSPPKLLRVTFFWPVAWKPGSTPFDWRIHWSCVCRHAARWVYSRFHAHGQKKRDPEQLRGEMYPIPRVPGVLSAGRRKGGQVYTDRKRRQSVEAADRRLRRLAGMLLRNARGYASASAILKNAHRRDRTPSTTRDATVTWSPRTKSKVRRNRRYCWKHGEQLTTCESGRSVRLSRRSRYAIARKVKGPGKPLRLEFG